MRIAARVSIVVLLVVVGLTVALTSTSMAAPKSAKVFWMVTAEVPLAKLPAYHQLNAEKISPLQLEHGYSWVVSWQTIVGEIEEVIAVAQFESMDDYLKARQSLLASPEWAAVAPELNAMTRSIKTRLLRATAYSPLQ